MSPIDPIMTGCHKEGINGNCGENCPVLLDGECSVEEEMYEVLSEEVIEDLKMIKEVKKERLYKKYRKRCKKFYERYPDFTGNLIDLD